MSIFLPVFTRTKSGVLFEIIVGELPNNGEPLEIKTDKKSKNVKFVVTRVSAETESAGLAEIEIY